MVFVSLLTKAQDSEQIANLTFGTTSEVSNNEIGLKKNKKELIHSLVIISILVMIVIYFSPLGIG